MHNGKQKGLITELECELAFAKLGFAVLKPICDNYRYDYVVDIGTRFIRVQCKTCRINQFNTTIEFSAKTSHPTKSGSKVKTYNQDEIDYFYTFYDNESYLIPVENNIIRYSLRLKQPKNNQFSNVRLAKDYEIKTILNRLEGIEINELGIIHKGENFNYCKSCGEKISPYAVYCSDCIKKQEPNPNLKRIPPREELKQNIRNLSLAGNSRLYGVSRKTIEKWSENYKLPIRKYIIDSYSDEEWQKL